MHQTATINVARRAEEDRRPDAVLRRPADARGPRPARRHAVDATTSSSAASASPTHRATTACTGAPATTRRRRRGARRSGVAPDRDEHAGQRRARRARPERLDPPVQPGQHAPLLDRARQVPGWGARPVLRDKRAGEFALYDECTHPHDRVHAAAPEDRPEPDRRPAGDRLRRLPSGS